MNAVEYFKADNDKKAALWLDPENWSISERVNKQAWTIDLLELLAARLQAYDIIFIRRPNAINKLPWVGSIVRFDLDGEQRYEIGDWYNDATKTKTRAIYDYSTDSITELSRTKFAIDHMRPAEFKYKSADNELVDYQDKWIVIVHKTYNHPRGFVEFLVHILTPTVVEFYSAYNVDRTKPIVDRKAFAKLDAFKCYEDYHPLAPEDVSMYLAVMEEQDKSCKILDPIQ